ncbi:hypothetical protein [Corallococcus sp. EGB]|uniref:hypothetical protein n=1 Tax=Corallococcus sp. EGB TaxID=1521117 RepID=UPI001CC15213|nr:hypothetical protein [Corallococcus sp. EGB]
MRTSLSFSLIIAAWTLPSLALAQPSAECGPYDFDAQAKAQVFTIKAPTPKQPVSFQSEAKACPAQGECGWKQRSYLIPGDTVLAGPEQGGFRCAYYVTAKGKPLAGFLPAANLEPAKGEKGLDAAVLAGTWVYAENEIVFTSKAGGLLHAEGNATAVVNGTANTGGFAEDVKPGGEELRIGDPKEEDECLVTVQRRGPYLLVSDNLQCGGLNVSFKGLYIRKKK